MKRHLLALVLLVFAATVHAADLTMTVTTDPPPPWSATEPVVLRMTFTNHASEARRGWFEIRDLDRAVGLVDRIRLRPESWAGYDWNGNASDVCTTLSPNYDRVLTWCDTTVPIMPGESLTLSFDVIAFPNAVGYRDAFYELYPMTPDTVVQVPGAPVARVPVRFAYGLVPNVPVPGIGSIAALLLGLGLLLAASWRMYGATPMEGLKS